MTPFRFLVFEANGSFDKLVVFENRNSIDTKVVNQSIIGGPFQRLYNKKRQRQYECQRFSCFTNKDAQLQGFQQRNFNAESFLRFIDDSTFQIYGRMVVLLENEHFIDQRTQQDWIVAYAPSLLNLLSTWRFKFKAMSLAHDVRVGLQGRHGVRIDHFTKVVHVNGIQLMLSVVKSIDSTVETMEQLQQRIVNENGWIYCSVKEDWVEFGLQ